MRIIAEGLRFGFWYDGFGEPVAFRVLSDGVSPFDAYVVSAVAAYIVSGYDVDLSLENWQGFSRRYTKEQVLADDFEAVVRRDYDAYYDRDE